MSELGGGASRSTEEAAGTSSATDVSLREYVSLCVDALRKLTEERFRAMDEKIEASFESSQRAIDKADIATEKRFEGVNEFRSALSDQARLFVTQEQLTATSEKLEAGYQRNREAIDGLAARLDRMEGSSAGSRLTYGTMAALLAAFATVVGLLVVAANWLSGQ